MPTHKPRSTGKEPKPKGNEPKMARRLGRVGILTRQPLAWATATVLMGKSDKPRLRRAAVRAATCYLAGAVVGNLPKPLFNRAQPRHSAPKKPQFLRGSFPSGHGAAEVAYVFGAAQEAPILFLPLGTAAALAHWSLVRGGKHYLSDLLVGGTLGVLIAFAALRIRTPTTVTEIQAERSHAPRVAGGGRH